MAQTTSAEEVHTRLLSAADTSLPELAGVFRAMGPVAFPDREDNGIGDFLCRSIVGQQLSTKAARCIWARIERLAQEERVAVTDLFVPRFEEGVKDCGVSRNKIKALKSVRTAMIDGSLDSDELHLMDHESRSLRLLSIWGIGQWTCDMASIFHCRCPDIWPEGDITVQKTFARFIGRRKPARAASLFSPYRSYVALAMWQIVDAPPSS